MNMDKKTHVIINLEKIRDNSAAVVRLCNDAGIEVIGVTKGVCAAVPFVQAMVDGGICHLADARIKNIRKLRNNGFKQEMTLLRIPGISESREVVEITDYSLNSEIATIEELSKNAQLKSKIHKIIIMLDVGDLREGLLPGDICDTVNRAGKLPGIEVVGLGTNMGCYGGILPSMDNLEYLIKAAKTVEKNTGIRMRVISGGGTSSLKLVAQGVMPKGINQLRIGEGILLGTDTTHNVAIPWLHQDTFMLNAEVVEVKTKPSVPIGEIGRDAFGNMPVFEDHGLRKRAIIMVGRQDVSPEGLIPADPKMTILGASSDHMIVDVTDADENVTVGSQITFRPNYQGMLFLCNSDYIEKKYIDKEF